MLKYVHRQGHCHLESEMKLTNQPTWENDSVPLQHTIEASS